MVGHGFNPSTKGAEANISLSLRPAWSAKQFQYSHDSPDKPCLKKTKAKKEKEKEKNYFQ